MKQMITQILIQFVLGMLISGFILFSLCLGAWLFSLHHDLQEIPTRQEVQGWVQK